jgi:hypothetical protein
MLPELLHQTAGIGVGTFLGALIGLSVRARQGKRSGLVRGSVFLTSVLVGMAAWVAMAVLRGVMG